MYDSHVTHGRMDDVFGSEPITPTSIYPLPPRSVHTTLSTMRSAWPRVRPKLSAFYRCCRCYTCLAHPDHAAVLRRPPTGTRITQGMAMKSALFTAFICTSAALDVEFKQKTRRKLDNAIATAEQELAEGQERQDTRLAALRGNARERDERKDGSRRTVLENDVLGPDQRGTGHPGTEAGQDELWDQLLQMTARKATSASSVTAQISEALEHLEQHRAPLQHNIAHCPHSLYGNSNVRDSAGRWTPKKLVTFEYSVAKLAMRILIHVDAENVEGFSLKPLTQQLSDLSAQLSLLSKEDALELKNTPRLPFPQYTPITTDASEEMAKLQAAINNLFEMHRAGILTRQDTVTRLAYNLLVSQAPPTLPVFTNLIKQFSRIKEYKLAEFVMDAASDSHVRPDELYIHQVLSHYLRKHDSKGFMRFARLTQGEHNGLMLARPNYPGEPKRLEQAPLNAEVWHALISGFLRFKNPEKALDLHERMLQAGFGSNLNIIVEIMKYYAGKARNIEKAWSVWSGICKSHLPSDSKTRLLPGSPEHHSIRAALLMCKQWGRSQHFAKIYKKALRHGLAMDALLPRNIANRCQGPSDAMVALQRRVRVAEHKTDLLQGDMIKWTLHVAASKMFLLGNSMDEVRKAFLEIRSPADLFGLIEGRRNEFAEVVPLCEVTELPLARKPVQSLHSSTSTSGTRRPRIPRLPSRPRVSFGNVELPPTSMQEEPVPAMSAWA